MASINKEEKYDRQLRLWASAGQSRLEQARVLVCQPTLTSLDLLKNLILPGIGHFTIVDTKRLVTQMDLSANFYLSDDDLGKDWAETVVSKLGELNEDVESDVLHVHNMEAWWDTVDAEFWKSYALVVMPFEYQRPLKDLYNLNIPTVVINSIGFYGFIRLVSQDFEVVEAHGESIYDLRIMNPWNELKQYCEAIDVKDVDVEKQSSIPYLVIQMKALEEWKMMHEGRIPKTTAEKTEYRRLISSWRDRDSQQLNFDEAENNARKVFFQTRIRSNVEDIFSKLSTHFGDGSNATQFWILAKALKEFVDKNDGFLPLKGELPDMDSCSDQYIALQNVYRAKAERDLLDFKNGLSTILAEISTDIVIREDVVRSFVKNANQLFFSTNTCVPLTDKNFSHVIHGEFTDSAVLLLGYLLLEGYIMHHKVFPTTDAIHSLIDKAHEYYLSEDNDKLQKVLYEMIRSEGVELGNIAAFMGGIGGQEAIKLITGQYIPLDNVMVFDGIRSVTEKWKVD